MRPSAWRLAPADGGGEGANGAGEGGGGGAGAGGAGTGDRVPHTVPYSRFQEVVSKKTELEGENKRLRGEVQALTEKGATVDTLSSTLERERKERATERAAWDTERALIDAGLTDQEGRDVALFHYGKLPSENRPKVGDWLGGFKGDPAKAPKSLQPFLPKPDAGAGGAGGGGGGAGGGTGAGAGVGGGERRGPPNTRTGADPAGAGAANREVVSAQKLREVRQAAQKSGDWSEWRRLTGQTEPEKK